MGPVPGYERRVRLLIQHRSRYRYPRPALLGPQVAVYSQANLVAESLADYLARRPQFKGTGTEAKFLTTGDPKAVSNRATQFLRRRIAFGPV